LPFLQYRAQAYFRQLEKRGLSASSPSLSHFGQNLQVSVHVFAILVPRSNILVRLLSDYILKIVGIELCFKDITLPNLLSSCYLKPLVPLHIALNMSDLLQGNPETPERPFGVQFILRQGQTLPALIRVEMAFWGLRGSLELNRFQRLDFSHPFIPLEQPPVHGFVPAFTRLQ